METLFFRYASILLLVPYTYLKAFIKGVSSNGIIGLLRFVVFATRLPNLDSSPSGASIVPTIRKVTFQAVIYALYGFSEIHFIPLYLYIATQISTLIYKYPCKQL